MEKIFYISYKHLTLFLFCMSVYVLVCVCLIVCLSVCLFFFISQSCEIMVSIIMPIYIAFYKKNPTNKQFYFVQIGLSDHIFLAKRITILFTNKTNKCHGHF